MKLKNISKLKETIRMMGNQRSDRQIKKKLINNGKKMSID